MICPDLYKDIVEYTPLADLLLLSKASPIFDVVIKRVGRKIFYYGDHVVDLSTDDYTIIETEFGKKYLLCNQKYTYIIMFSNDIVMKRILAHRSCIEKNDWERDISEFAAILYDPKKDIVITVDGSTVITSGPIGITKVNNIVNICPVTDARQIQYIDINNKIYKCDEFNSKDRIEFRKSRHTYNYAENDGNVYYGHFKILYNGTWTNNNTIGTF